MSNQGMVKECKFCETKFGNEVRLCPNCGSTDLKLVAQGFLNVVNEENEKAEKKKKEGIVIGVSILVGVFLLLIVASKVFIRWYNKNVEKVSMVAQTEKVFDYSNIGNEEWKEAMFPLLNKFFALNKDDEIVEVFDNALVVKRPIYDWEHYLYASCLVDFYRVEGIWMYEQNVGKLKDYQKTELLYYCLLYWDLEEREELTTEEREKLQRYVTELRQDVIIRFILTEEKLEQLWLEALEEYGYVEYSMVERLLK